jgi:hypothetical protein
MTATVVSTRGQRWSAASWLLDWLLTTVAKEVTEVELAGDLRGRVDENLGWFSLKDLPRNQSDEVIKIFVPQYSGSLSVVFLRSYRHPRAAGNRTPASQPSPPSTVTTSPSLSRGSGGSSGYPANCRGAAQTEDDRGQSRPKASA